MVPRRMPLNLGESPVRAGFVVKWGWRFRNGRRESITVAARGGKRFFVRHLEQIKMGESAGTILDRAVRLWEVSSFAYLYPNLTNVEEFELSHRIAEEYPGYFDDELLKLLSSPNAVVVAHALTILRWMKHPALAELPEQLLTDERTVTIGCCLIHSRSLGEIARECADEIKGRAAPD
jgi:hypothetical protein